MESLAHKIELKPNNKQKTYFRKACGIARFTWNWALANWNEYYHFNLAIPEGDRDPISGMMLKKEFNHIKREEFPWVFEVSKYVSQQPFIQLGRAYQRFFKGISKKPKFKKKSKSHDSFYIGGDQIKVRDKKVWVPNLGWVRLREQVRFKGTIRSATFSRKADRWFVAIQIDTKVTKTSPKGKTIGLDLGIDKMIQLSDGDFIQAPKPLSKKLTLLKRRQRKLAKKTFQSKNYQKQKLKIQRLYAKIANIRRDTLQQATTDIIKKYKTISIEDLHVKGMLKNHKLARAIADIGFYELRRQLEYKSQIYGNILYIADRFYPSSKLCSDCGNIKESLSLGDRIYKCSCGFKIDRDLNAAINLEKLINEKLRPARSKVTPREITALTLGYN